jgi:hypothetical protein
MKATRPALFAALDLANRLFSAYKLVEPNYLANLAIRTLGDADVLYYLAFLDGQGLCPSSSYAVIASWFGTSDTISADAQENLSGVNQPIRRRVIRCFELVEHGYYTEALIVCFALLDDLVQETLLVLLQEKGLAEEDAKADILRSIEKDRLRKFLGTVLKLLSGKSLMELWPGSAKALAWLNKRRNAVMHAGATATRADAYLSLYAVLRCLQALEGVGVIILDFGQKMVDYAFFYAHQLAEAGQDWVAQENCNLPDGGPDKGTP